MLARRLLSVGCYEYIAQTMTFAILADSHPYQQGRVNNDVPDPDRYVVQTHQTIVPDGVSGWPLFDYSPETSFLLHRGRRGWHDDEYLVRAVPELDYKTRSIYPRGAGRQK